MNQQDCLEDFVKEKCKVRQGKEVNKRDLYNSYRDYCYERNLKIRTTQNFFVVLMSKMELTQRRSGEAFILEGISL